MFLIYVYNIVRLEYNHQQNLFQARPTKHKTANIANYLRLKSNQTNLAFKTKYNIVIQIYIKNIIQITHVLPFCRTLRHIVALRFPKCFLSFSILQSVIGNDLLSKGSAHLGSPSERQTQHLIESP